MPSIESTAEKAKREYSQLLRLCERLVTQLERVRDELVAPGTLDLLREIRLRTGSSPQEGLSDAASAVEEALRALKLYESDVQQALLAEPGHMSVDGAPNLPAPLARFLAERKDFPGFSFEVHQDEVRGWIISWKEYTPFGTVRGYGQFYERPYAWIDD